jgi:hypothetical protein
MTFQRGIDSSDPAPRTQPISARAGAHEDRHASPWRVASGTLACPRCDAPIALGERAVSLTEDLGCPFCRHAAAARDFLSLAAPSRPTHVEIRARPRARSARR